MSQLPYDVVGIIIDFVASHAFQALELGLVSHSWFQGFTCCERLLSRFAVNVWYGPRVAAQTPPFQYSYAAVRDRMHAAATLAASSLKPRELHPIESCDVGSLCPQFAEGLRPTSRHAQGSCDVPVLHCGVCGKNVYVAKSIDEIATYAALGDPQRCVLMRKGDASHLASRITFSVLLCVAEASLATHILAALRTAAKRHRSPHTATITFDGMILENARYEQIVFLIEVVDPHEAPPHQHQPAGPTTTALSTDTVALPPSGLRFGERKQRPVPSVVYFEDTIDAVPAFMNTWRTQEPQRSTIAESERIGQDSPGTFARQRLLPLLDDVRRHGVTARSSPPLSSAEQHHMLLQMGAAVGTPLPDDE